MFLCQTKNVYPLTRPAATEMTVSFYGTPCLPLVMELQQPTGLSEVFLSNGCSGEEALVWDLDT